MSKLINGSFEISLKEVRKPQDEIKDQRKEISEFKVSLEFTENELHDKMKKLQEKHEIIHKAVDEICISQVNSDFVYDKSIDSEERSRRNNLRIHGISESKYETWEKCEEKIDEVFLEKLGLEIFILNVHTVSKEVKTIKARSLEQ